MKKAFTKFFDRRKQKRRSKGWARGFVDGVAGRRSLSDSERIRDLRGYSAGFTAGEDAFTARHLALCVCDESLSRVGDSWDNIRDAEALDDLKKRWSVRY